MTENNIKEKCEKLLNRLKFTSKEEEFNEIKLELKKIGNWSLELDTPLCHMRPWCHGRHSFYLPYFFNLNYFTYHI